MINVAGLRSEDEDFRTLRNLIIYGLCYDITQNNLKSFHGVDMVKKWAKGFLDNKGVDQYQFSGDHPYYMQVLENVYRPLVERRLVDEYENNTFKIPDDSRLHNICRNELRRGDVRYIEWNNINWNPD